MQMLEQLLAGPVGESIGGKSHALHLLRLDEKLGCLYKIPERYFRKKTSGEIKTKMNGLLRIPQEAVVFFGEFSKEHLRVLRMFPSETGQLKS